MRLSLPPQSLRGDKKVAITQPLWVVMVGILSQPPIHEYAGQVVHCILLIPNYPKYNFFIHVIIQKRIQVVFDHGDSSYRNSMLHTA